MHNPEARLFNIGKIGLFLDGYSPGTEKRPGRRSSGNDRLS